MAENQAPLTVLERGKVTANRKQQELLRQRAAALAGEDYVAVAQETPTPQLPLVEEKEEEEHAVGA